MYHLSGPLDTAVQDFLVCSQDFLACSQKSEIHGSHLKEYKALLEFLHVYPEKPSFVAALTFLPQPEETK